MSTQESSFDLIRWSHSKVCRSLSNGSVRATVLWAAHWLLSVALLLFILISYKTFWLSSFDESKPNLDCGQISITHCLAVSSIAHCQLLLYAFRVRENPWFSAVKCARRVWGGKIRKPFWPWVRVRMFLRCWMSPIHSDRRGTSNYISKGTGPVARSQPADVRIPFVSWTFAIRSASHRLVVSIPSLLLVFES